MNLIIHSQYQKFKENLEVFIKDFNSKGILFGDGKRNKIKLFELGEKTVNIKSFKIPNLINKIVYAYFRKSKARRSYDFANLLIEKGIGTPAPIAYFENSNWLGLKDSYYLSEHLVTELTYRELIKNSNYPDYDTILRQFTKFTFDLHQKGIEFLDHSPGNTLIKKIGDDKYDFFLVDLNRMNFHHQMTFEQRINNFSRLTPQEKMVRIMSNEYSKFYTEQSEAEIFKKMWMATSQFQEKFARKKRLKKKLKFW